ncbi:protein-glutamine gamma-glutamyltransferase E isoform X2 [Archocentrus centrarchus]|uniref:protein-glutamine gamma-glutamyltransferase E isoform X2 n=1 Tax=Archocentrus centrarchus TaxID=63155 RepID=UPI0011E9D717|nr:protein-glutamine gamma-glutamyltransferase E-like isoform X2 [Archocentrus centrarchus]
MTSEPKQSIFKSVNLNCETNNAEHRTKKLSQDQLIVRRGQPFTVTAELTQPFYPDRDPLTFTAVTGEQPSEDLGTKSCFGIPNKIQRSSSAKAVWKVDLGKISNPATGSLSLTITPPADTPVGQYDLFARLKDTETLLTTLVVLFNPWCPDDSVSLSDEAERQEYVMNEQGIIYNGSGNYLSSIPWDFGQFEQDMVKICLMMLDVNPKHLANAANDVSARCNPIYVSRVVSAMINSADDCGVLQGRWAGPFWGGVAPSHWSGSYPILKQWYNIGCNPVKYGQCWVFAGVMCSVMRLLGIPCRVVTNYQSAHDTNKNLIIDVYHADYGVREKESKDSIWNFHVWVECWMKRPDLAKDGAYCCGPASVKAILDGETDLKYDVPFVFAEVNADCMDWLCKANGTMLKIFSDTKRVGQNISTKAVGSNTRVDITDNYKFKEGTKKERDVFKYALTRNDYKNEKDKVNGNITNPALNGGNMGGAGSEGTQSTVQLPPISMRFEEVSKPIKGKDVSLNLVLRSVSSTARSVSISISVQAMRYNGSLAENIQAEMKDQTLLPGKDLSIPILVPYSVYHKPMVDSQSMKISAVVTDKQKPNNAYLAENDVVLLNPPISITLLSPARLNRRTAVEVVFMNPVNETLRECSLTISGSGLVDGEDEYKLPDLKPSNRVRITSFFVPLKTGEKTLVANFDCSSFRHIKCVCTVNVTP